VPRTMMLTVIIGFVTAVPFTLAILFSSSDLEAVANSPLPILEVFYQATGSQAATAVVSTFWSGWC
jgi:choline transport protein